MLTVCILKDQFSRTLSGAGKERDGVHYFTDVKAARVNKTAQKVDEVWRHQRLGHPAFSVLLSLPLFSNVSISASSSSCDTCFRAKQTREMFSDSINKTS